MPGIARENYWFRRHLVVYEALAPRCRGVVLEAGCGEGYGADLLAGGATRVLALDYDAPGDRARRTALPAGGGGAGQPRRAAGARRRRSTRWCRCRSSSTSGTRSGSCASADGCWPPAARCCSRRPNRHHVLPRPRHAAQPVPHAGAGGGRAGRTADDGGFVDVAVLGLHHGPRLRALDAAHGGSLVDAQTVAALGRGVAGGAATGRRRRHDGRFRPAPRRPGPPRRREPRPHRQGDGPVNRPTHRVESEDSPSQEGRLAVTKTETRRQVGAFALVLHSHLPWLAHHGRVAGRGGVALPVVGARLPPRARRRATAGRRGPSRPAHPRRHPGAGRPARRPALPPRRARLARRLAAARPRRRRAPARPRRPRAPGRHGRARRLRDAWRHGASPVLRSPQPTPGRSSCSAAPRPTRSAPLLLAPGARVRPRDRPRRHRAAARRAAGRDLGARVRLRPRHGGRLRGGGRARASSSTAPRCTATRRFARPVGASGVRRVRPRPRRHLPRVVPARGLSRRPRLPRLPHLRPRLRPQARPRHRPARCRRSEKRPYEPERAAAAVARDAADFVVGRPRTAPRRSRDQHGRPALTVAAFDTELFGHWWHEGPAWLEAVLRALPAAGVRVTTLRGARRRRARRRPGRAAPVVMGIGQGLAGVGGRGR